MIFTSRFWRETCCTTLVFLRIAGKVMGIRCGIHTNKIQVPLVVCELNSLLSNSCPQFVAVQWRCMESPQGFLDSALSQLHQTPWQLQAAILHPQKSTYNIRPSQSTRSAILGTKSLKNSRNCPFPSLGMVHDYSLADIRRTSPYRFLPLHAATKRRVVN